MPAFTWRARETTAEKAGEATELDATATLVVRLELVCTCIKRDASGYGRHQKEKKKEGGVSDRG